MTPVFLNLDEVFAIHADQIERYGGEPGLRDEGLLRSALAQPEASFGGERLHTTLSEMAALRCRVVSREWDGGRVEYGGHEPP